MNYCNANESKEHIILLLKWLEEEVGSAGGDGDSLWYSRFYNVKDIYPIIKEINNKYWKVTLLDDKTIKWGEGQEWCIITNDENQYNTCPDWIQAKIRY